jgi:hypothetical protein
LAKIQALDDDPLCKGCQNLQAFSQIPIAFGRAIAVSYTDRVRDAVLEVLVIQVGIERDLPVRG